MVVTLATCQPLPHHSRAGGAAYIVRGLIDSESRVGAVALNSVFVATIDSDSRGINNLGLNFKLVAAMASIEPLKIHEDLELSGPSPLNPEAYLKSSKLQSGEVEWHGNGNQNRYMHNQYL